MLTLSLAALGASSSDIAEAKKACATAKAEQQNKSGSKGDTRLARKPGMSAAVACNLEFIPCDDDPKSNRCDQVVARYLP